MTCVVGGMGAIRRHVFVLAINNSGSTFLTKALGKSPGAWSLPREGQHVPGFAGPSSRGTGTGLLWAASAESEALFTDRGSYDWAQNSRVWEFQAEADNADAELLIIASPPFLMISELLAQAFPDANFLILLRHPLAVIEGILRGTAGEDAALVEPAFQHVIRGMEYQHANVQTLGSRALTIRYEDMCASPDNVGAAILQLAPELRAVDLMQPIAVKGRYDEALRNMNGDAMARLDPAMRAQIEARLADRADLLAAFGYEATKP
jgi:Sulfotransferase family